MDGSGRDEKVPSPVADALKALRNRAALSVRDVAAELGWGHTRYQHYEDRYGKPALPVSLVADLIPILAGKGSPPITAEQIGMLAGSEAHVAMQIAVTKASVQSPSGTAANTAPSMAVRDVRPAVGAPAPDWRLWPRDIEVRGIAIGGAAGDFRLNGSVVDYVRRPPAISTLRDVAALYCVSDSMAPWRKAGSLIYFTDARPAVPGDHVVVEMRSDDGEPGAAYLKQLVRRTASKLVLRQYNPSAELVLHAEKVLKIWRVLELEDLLGL